MNYVKQISVPDLITLGAMSRFIDHENADSESDSCDTDEDRYEVCQGFLDNRSSLKYQLDTRLDEEWLTQCETSEDRKAVKVIYF